MINLKNRALIFTSAMAFSAMESVYSSISTSSTPVFGAFQVLEDALKDTKTSYNDLAEVSEDTMATILDAAYLIQKGEMDSSVIGRILEQDHTKKRNKAVAAMDRYVQDAQADLAGIEQQLFTKLTIDFEEIEAKEIKVAAIKKVNLDNLPAQIAQIPTQTLHFKVENNHYYLMQIDVSINQIKYFINRQGKQTQAKSQAYQLLMNDNGDLVDAELIQNTVIRRQKLTLTEITIGEIEYNIVKKTDMEQTKFSYDEKVALRDYLGDLHFKKEGNKRTLFKFDAQNNPEFFKIQKDQLISVGVDSTQGLTLYDDGEGNWRRENDGISEIIVYAKLRAKESVRRAQQVDAITYKQSDMRQNNLPSALKDQDLTFKLVGKDELILIHVDGENNVTYQQSNGDFTFDEGGAFKLYKDEFGYWYSDLEQQNKSTLIITVEKASTKDSEVITPKEIDTVTFMASDILDGKWPQSLRKNWPDDEDNLAKHPVTFKVVKKDSKGPNTLNLIEVTAGGITFLDKSGAFTRDEADAFTIYRDEFSNWYTAPDSQDNDTLVITANRKGSEEKINIEKLPVIYYKQANILQTNLPSKLKDKSLYFIKVIGVKQRKLIALDAGNERVSYKDKDYKTVDKEQAYTIYGDELGNWYSEDKKQDESTLIIAAEQAKGQPTEQTVGQVHIIKFPEDALVKASTHIPTSAAQGRWYSFKKIDENTLKLIKYQDQIITYIDTNGDTTTDLDQAPDIHKGQDSNWYSTADQASQNAASLVFNLIPTIEVKEEIINLKQTSIRRYRVDQLRLDDRQLPDWVTRAQHLYGASQQMHVAFEEVLTRSGEITNLRLIKIGTDNSIQYVDSSAQITQIPEDAYTLSPRGNGWVRGDQLIIPVTVTADRGSIDLGATVNLVRVPVASINFTAMPVRFWQNIRYTLDGVINGGTGGAPYGISELTFKMDKPTLRMATQLTLVKHEKQDNSVTEIGFDGKVIEGSGNPYRLHRMISGWSYNGGDSPQLVIPAAKVKQINREMIYEYDASQIVWESLPVKLRTFLNDRQIEHLGLRITPESAPVNTNHSVKGLKLHFALQRDKPNQMLLVTLNRVNPDKFTYRRSDGGETKITPEQVRAGLFYPTNVFTLYRHDDDEGWYIDAVDKQNPVLLRDGIEIIPQRSGEIPIYTYDISDLNQSEDTQIPTMFTRLSARESRDKTPIYTDKTRLQFEFIETSRIKPNLLKLIRIDSQTRQPVYIGADGNDVEDIKDAYTLYQGRDRAWYIDIAKAQSHKASTPVIEAIQPRKYLFVTGQVSYITIDRNTIAQTLASWPTTLKEYLEQDKVDGTSKRLSFVVSANGKTLSLIFPAKGKEVYLNSKLQPASKQEEVFTLTKGSREGWFGSGVVTTAQTSASAAAASSSSSLPQLPARLQNVLLIPQSIKQTKLPVGNFNIYNYRTDRISVPESLRSGLISTYQSSQLPEYLAFHPGWSTSPQSDFGQAKSKVPDALKLIVKNADGTFDYVGQDGKLVKTDGSVNTWADAWTLVRQDNGSWKAEGAVAKADPVIIPAAIYSHTLQLNVGEVNLTSIPLHRLNTAAFSISSGGEAGSGTSLSILDGNFKQKYLSTTRLDDLYLLEEEVLFDDSSTTTPRKVYRLVHVKDGKIIADDKPYINRLGQKTANKQQAVTLRKINNDGHISYQIDGINIIQSVRAIHSRTLSPQDLSIGDMLSVNMGQFSGYSASSGQSVVMDGLYQVIAIPITDSLSWSDATTFSKTATQKGFRVKTHNSNVIYYQKGEGANLELVFLAKAPDNTNVWFYYYIENFKEKWHIGSFNAGKSGEMFTLRSPNPLALVGLSGSSTSSAVNPTQSALSPAFSLAQNVTQYFASTTVNSAGIIIETGDYTLQIVKPSRFDFDTLGEHFKTNIEQIPGRDLTSSLYLIQDENIGREQIYYLVDFDLQTSTPKPGRPFITRDGEQTKDITQALTLVKRAGGSFVELHQGQIDPTASVYDSARQVIAKPQTIYTSDMGEDDLTIGDILHDDANTTPGDRAYEIIAFDGSEIITTQMHSVRTSNSALVDPLFNPIDLSGGNDIAITSDQETFKAYSKQEVAFTSSDPSTSSLQGNHNVVIFKTRSIYSPTKERYFMYNFNLKRWYRLRKSLTAGAIRILGATTPTYSWVPQPQLQYAFSVDRQV